jgi:hypothetical protein
LFRASFLRSGWPVAETTTHYRKKAEERLDAPLHLFTFLGKE